MLTSAVSASASPGDPYLPNVAAGYCKGGGRIGDGVVYCDGVKYPDQSYWREIVDVKANSSKVVCMIDHGGALPWSAPPGGCGGTSYYREATAFIAAPDGD